MITPQIRTYLVEQKSTGTKFAVRFITPDKIKFVVCPYCEKYWITSIRGGGLIVGGANRHVKACSKKHLEEE